MVETCTVHRVCLAPNGNWSRSMYEAIATARRSGNYSIVLTESQCNVCMSLAHAVFEHQMAVQEAMSYLNKGQRYRVLPVRGEAYGGHLSAM